MPHHQTDPNSRHACVPTWFACPLEDGTRYIGGMKMSSLPAVPVEPALRAELEAALEEGESMDEFIEQAVAEQLRRRKAARAAFLERGLESLTEAERTGVYVSAEQVLKRLEDKLDDARRRVATRSR